MFSISYTLFILMQLIDLLKGNLIFKNSHSTTPSRLQCYINHLFHLQQKKLLTILLPVLTMVLMRGSEKLVVRVAQCVAALVPVHKTPIFLLNVVIINVSST